MPARPKVTLSTAPGSVRIPVRGAHLQSSPFGASSAPTSSERREGSNIGRHGFMGGGYAPAQNMCYDAKTALN